MLQRCVLQPANPSRLSLGDPFHSSHNDMKSQVNTSVKWALISYKPVCACCSSPKWLPCQRYKTFCTTALRGCVRSQFGFQPCSGGGVWMSWALLPLVVRSQSMQTSESSRLAPMLTMLTVTIDITDFLQTTVTAVGGYSECAAPLGFWRYCYIDILQNAPLNDNRMPASQQGRPRSAWTGRTVSESEGESFRVQHLTPAGRSLRGNSSVSPPLRVEVKLLRLGWLWGRRDGERVSEAPETSDYLPPGPVVKCQPSEKEVCVGWHHILHW